MHRTSNLAGVVAMLAGTCRPQLHEAGHERPAAVRGALFLRGVAWRGVAWRGVAATLACELLPVALGDWRFVSSALHPRALMRAAGGTLSVLCYIVALARPPIADVIAILQTAPLILSWRWLFSFVNVSERRASLLRSLASPAPSWLHSRDRRESRRRLYLLSRPLS
jgi:hypothetical protein